MVYIQFLMGDPEQPLYFGGICRNLTDRPLWEGRFHQRIEANIKTSRETKEILPKRPSSMGRWQLPLGAEVPMEILDTPYEPNTFMIFKTEKGASFFIRDRDQFEQTRILDRSGQELSFVSPVTTGANQANEARRGNASARDRTPHSSELWDDNDDSTLRKDPRDYSNILGKTASVELAGLTGQGLKITSRENGEQIEIRSHGEGEDYVSLVLGGGTGATELVGEYDGEEVFRIAASARTKTVEISGSVQVVIRSGSVSIDAGDVRISGNVSIEGDLSVGGNTMLTDRSVGGES